MARLIANVVLAGENGEVVTLLSGTEAPEWALPLLGSHVLDESEQAPAPDDDTVVDDSTDDIEGVEVDETEASTDGIDDESEQAPAPAKPRRR